MPVSSNVEVVAVQLLRLVARRVVVRRELRLRLFDHVGVLALEPVELPLDHVGEPAAAPDHDNVS